MNVSCPHCGKQLKLSDKFQSSLQNMKPDQKARVKCTQCAKPFELDSRTVVAGSSEAAPSGGTGPKPTEVCVKPPEPPDMTWLKDGVFEDQEVVEEIPLALILMPEEAGRSEVIKAVEALGYRAEIASSIDSAIEKMDFVNYSSVILHTGFEPKGLAGGKFHAYMCNMSMSKRRYIFYALIGKDLNTLYDLEALAYSANIVVNESDVSHFGTILRKTIPEYEILFGPLMEELRVLGK
jgi:hypothetical protein